MSVQAIAWVLDHSTAKGTARCVLVSIANHVDPDGTGWVHVKRVLLEANCSLVSYRRAVQDAEEAGELVRQVHAGGSAKMHDAHRPNLFTFPGVAGVLVEREAQPVRQQSDSPVLRRVFDRWVEVTGRDATRTRLTGQRRKKLEARLREGYSEEELLAAVNGITRSQFHMGMNDSGTRYDDLTVICRDGSQVERFAALGTVEDTQTVKQAVKQRGCALCDNGFVFHADGTVSICNEC